MAKKSAKTDEKSKTSAASMKDPVTMADLLAKYSGALKTFKRGDKVKGTVIDIQPKKVTLDIGGKSQAIVAEKAYQESKDFIKSLAVGDEVSATVIVGENPDGDVIISLRDAASDAVWEWLEKADKDGKEIAVVGKNVTQAGLIVDVQGLPGFIPNSQVGKEFSKDINQLLEKILKVKIIELDRKYNKVVLSEREVSDAEDIKEIGKEYEKIKMGEVFDGTVTTIANFGCFVQLAIGKKKTALEGLVHISELSWGKVGKVTDIINEGDTIKVRVIGKKDGKLALSIKQALKDPWEDIEKKYKKDSKFTGKAIKISEFGVFVELEKGVEGLVHITKIPPSHKINTGDSVNIYIEEVDKNARKISLGLVLTAKPVGYK